jgi:hypothetical protein
MCWHLNCLILLIEIQIVSEATVASLLRGFCNHLTHIIEQTNM